MTTLPAPFTGFRPMRACDAPDNLAEILYPNAVQVKRDGICCYVLSDNGGNIHVFSNTLKFIPNVYIRSRLTEIFKGKLRPCQMLCGELESTTGNFQATQSMVMRQSIAPVKFMYYIFDALDFNYRHDIYSARKDRVLLGMRDYTDQEEVSFLQDVEVQDATALQVLLDITIAHGFEGLMVRSLLGHYKFGDVTPREAYILKLKPFVDDEATIIGVNEAIDIHGIRKDTLGSFTLRHATYGEFDCAGQLSDEMKRRYWQDPPIGEIACFKYQKVGTKDKPRAPIFKGIRYDK